ncbi:hypothetical protein WJX73_006499 [Symbiochloris irregularis]|uniref:sn-1-specific diacylglycerol lipase n=1 Tax=Symbiochloris irregularis TaxID=706552 RepID=A0AAW1PNW3_9CHLO
MPALVLYGRRFHAALDTIPFPAVFAAVVHAVWIVLFGWLISVYHILTTPCKGQGVHYKVVSGGLLSLYVLCFLAEAGLTVLGLRGTPLETSKRKWMFPLLYLLSWLWLLQFTFAVYGTAMLPYSSPLCYPGLGAQGHVRNVVRTMIYTTWALSAGTVVVVLATYNSYGALRKPKEKSWEGRVKCWSWLMGCADVVSSNPAGDQGHAMEAPLPGIAQLVAGLFENIDMSPSDITAALILAAASQQQRRKMRIRRALTKAAEQRHLSQTEDDDTSQVTSEDERSETSDANAAQASGQAGAGRLSVVAEDDASSSGGNRSSTDSSGARTVNLAQIDEKELKELSGSGSFNLQRARFGLPQEQPQPQPQPRGHRRTRSQERLTDGSGHRRRPSSTAADMDRMSARLTEDELIIAHEPAAAVRALVQAEKQASLASQSPSESGVPVPAGVPGGPVDVPLDTASSLGGETEAALEARTTADSEDPPISGKFQAAITETGGGLPPPSELSTVPSSSVLGGLKSLFAPAANTPTGLEHQASLELPGPGGMGATMSTALSTVLTPSGQTMEVLGAAAATPNEIVQDYLGDRDTVSCELLREAATYARYACGVYGVTPLTETPSGCYGCRSPPITPSVIRRNTVALTGIEDEDLLFFSGSNVALAHLPYMVALERDRKAVVLAIRGTSSLADVVTDAVVRPAPMQDWLPEQYKSRLTEKQLQRLFAHGGILAATSAILTDLQANGLLSGLLRHESKRQEDENHEREQSKNAIPSYAKAAGTVMQELLDNKGWKLVVTGHSLGAGAASLLTLQLKDRYPGLKCWAYSPPGGLVSRSLLKIMEEWTISVVCGKDAVPRASVNNLSRLMDEMITALARCKHHKLRLLAGRWWRKGNRPPPEHLFCSYGAIPEECRALLLRYFQSREVKGKAIDMFPPGRVIFVRPIKQVDEHGRKKGRRLWDTVWVQPTELIAEGILVSPRMLTDHLIESTVMMALEVAITNHPANNQNPIDRRKSVEEAAQRGRMAQDIMSGHNPRDPHGGRRKSFAQPRA